MDVYVARQPIFNREKEVVAYELLYRDTDKNFFDGSVAASVATSILLMNSYISFGINNLVGDAKAFVNFGKALIDSDIPLLLDSNRVVVELLEDIVPDRLFIEKVKMLKSKGYTIALDDYVQGYLYDELTDLSDIIKVDFFGNTKDQIVNICHIWKRKGKILLAEKVETDEVYQWAKRIGFDYFQGYFFSKPTMLKSKGIQESSFQYVKVMEELSRREPDYKQIAKIIETDATLTYKLLKLVNSKFSLISNISSIQHALSILGIEAFEKWFSLAMVQNLSASKPSEIVKISLIRARFLENIGKSSKLGSYSQELLLAGILSVMDALLERPMQEIVETLPITGIIKNALVNKETPILDAFNLCIAYEKGDFDIAENLATKIQFDWHKSTENYLDAVKWSEELFLYMQS